YACAVVRATRHPYRNGCLASSTTSAACQQRPPLYSRTLAHERDNLALATPDERAEVIVPTQVSVLNFVAIACAVVGALHGRAKFVTEEQFDDVRSNRQLLGHVSRNRPAQIMDHPI